MVFFSCDGCGDALKKQQVEKHRAKCPSKSFSCIDCSTVFPGDAYKEHIKCITEEQKVSGKNFQPKEAKGEMKQQAWTDQLQSAIDDVDVSDKKLRDLLLRMKGYANVPRKQAKFLNFLKASLNVHDASVAASAWDAVSRAADKFNEERRRLAAAADTERRAKKAQANGDAAAANGHAADKTANTSTAAAQSGKKAKRKRKSSAAATAGDDATSAKAAKGDEQPADGVADASGEASADFQFNWKAKIKRALSAVLAECKRGTASLGQLMERVRSDYTDTPGSPRDSAHFDAVFAKKVDKLSAVNVIVVDGDDVKFPDS